MLGAAAPAAVTVRRYVLSEDPTHFDTEEDNGWVNETLQLNPANTALVTLPPPSRPHPPGSWNYLSTCNGQPVVDHADSLQTLGIFDLHHPVDITLSSEFD